MNINEIKNENEKKAILKEIYEYCENNKWDAIKLRHIGKKLNIQGNTVNELARMYIDYMDFSDIAKERLLNEINFLEQKSMKKHELINITNPILKIYGITTYNLWNNEEEKQLVLKIIVNYAEKVNYSNKELEKLAKELGTSIVTIRKYIAEYKGKNNNYKSITKENKLKNDVAELKDIYEYCIQNKYTKEATAHLAKKYNISEQTVLNRAKLYAVEFLYQTPEEWHEKKNKIIKAREKEEEKKLLKEIYDYCEANKFSKQSIRTLSDKYYVAPKTIMERAKKYAIEYLGLTNDEWKKKLDEYKKELIPSNKKEYPLEIITIYKILMKKENPEDIAEIIELSSYTIKTIETILYQYLEENEKKQDIEIIKDKINKYHEYRELIKKLQKDKKYIESSEIVRLYINSECDFVEQFYELIGIDEVEFNKHLRRAKRLDSKLYKQYLDKNQRTIEKYKDIINHIIYLINNKINENGVVRDFDMIDYYQITDLPLLKLYEIVRKNPKIFSISSSEIIRKFIMRYRKHEYTRENDIEQILKERVELNFELDKFGKPIPGTGEIFSEENKLKLVEILRENNLPVNRGMYSLVFKRYRLGLIELNDSKKLIKKI